MLRCNLITFFLIFQRKNIMVFVFFIIKM